MSSEDRVIAAFHDGRDDVYRYLVILGLGPAEAQEATQEAYLELLKAVRNGKEIRDMRAWTFRVAHNMALNALQRGRRSEPLDSGLINVLEDGKLTPESMTLQRERMAKLKSALQTLSPQQRQCVYLRGEGLQYREIADVIGVGVSTVSEFLSRAMTRLRRAMQ